MLRVCQGASILARPENRGGSLTHTQEKTPAALPKSDRGNDTPMQRSPSATAVNAATQICSSDTGGELFDLPVSLSPRLAWLDKHGITVLRDDTGWVAFALRGGVPVEAKGGTELDAEANLALKLSIVLWFEEAEGKEKA